MKKKILGLLILLGIYLIAFGIGLAFFSIFIKHMDIYLSILLSNVIATVVVWLFGVMCKTASVYDPYWSVQTVVIGLCLMIYYKNFNLGNILFLSIIGIWAIRLTYNFITTFNDLSYIDWRYKQIKEKTGPFYQIVNLLGICMVPTLVVHFASIPFYTYIINGYNFSILSIFGILVVLLAIGLELESDLDMHKFQKVRSSKKEIIRVGLWKYSRHPNYLGEILFWYGVALYVIIPNLGDWYLIIGAVINTCLFLFISIPLAENHLAGYKENYQEYKKETRMLLPFKK
jgi:steroid 5-alpha reductase family enzyme